MARFYSTGRAIALWALAISFHAQATCDDPAVMGCWLPPFSEGGDFNDQPPATEEEGGRLPTAVSVTVLPDGRVLYINGFEGDDQIDDTRVGGGIVPPGSNSRTRLLDLRNYLESGTDPRSSARWSVPTPETGGAGDLFCSDLKQLPDGRVIAAGGTINYDLDGKPWGEPPHRGEFEGIKHVRTFNPANDRWTRNADMNFARWYPSLVSLPDSESLMIASGLYRLIYNESQSNVRQTETYNIAANRWDDNGMAGEQSLPVYPRLHLMPNGWILYPAAGQTWNPLGQASDYETWRLMKWYQPETKSWANIAPAALGTRNTPFTLLLPLRPDPETGEYQTAQLLIAGGTPTSYPPALNAVDLVELVTWSASAPETVSREPLSSLNQARWFASGVLLPTGEVLAINGADRDQLVTPGYEIAVRATEQFDPESQDWTELAPSARDRTYHNSAALLPDGSVLVGGHAPQPADYGQSHENRPLGANNFRDPSFEIFRPPYLYRGPRPAITATDTTLKRGETHSVSTADAADQTLQVVLSRLPAVTHLQDADQRTVELPIVSRDAGSVQVRLTANNAILPSGFYYLFLTKDNGEGPTPSHSATVRVIGPAAPTPQGGSSGGGAMSESLGVFLLLALLAVCWMVVGRSHPTRD